MQTDGLRRKRLALLNKRKIDLRHQMIREQKRAAESEVEDLETQKRQEEVEKEIGLLKCARKDLF